jgi:glycogen debranching enzyme
LYFFFARGEEMEVFPSRRISVPLLALAPFGAQKLQSGLDAHMGGSRQRRRGNVLALGELFGVDRCHMREALLVPRGCRGWSGGELLTKLTQELLRATQADSCCLCQRAY